MPTEIQDSSFDCEVIQSDKPVIVEFYSPHCGPCKSVEKTLEQAKGDLGDDVKIVKVNVFTCYNTAQRYSIMSVPTVMSFVKGRITNSFTGVRLPSEYLEMVR